MLRMLSSQLGCPCCLMLTCLTWSVHRQVQCCEAGSKHPRVTRKLHTAVRAWSAVVERHIGKRAAGCRSYGIIVFIIEMLGASTVFLYGINLIYTPAIVLEARLTAFWPKADSRDMTRTTVSAPARQC